MRRGPPFAQGYAPLDRSTFQKHIARHVVPRPITCRKPVLLPFADRLCNSIATRKDPRLSSCRQELRWCLDDCLARLREDVDLRAGRWLILDESGRGCLVLLAGGCRPSRPAVVGRCQLRAVGLITSCRWWRISGFHDPLRRRWSAGSTSPS